MTISAVNRHDRIISIFDRVEGDIKRSHHCLSDDQFVDYAWHNFDPKTVLRHLSQTEEYFGQHRILLEGFWAWLVSLGDKYCAKRAIVLASGRLAVDAEECYTKRYGDRELLGEIVFRLSPRGYGFYEQIYRPIGGLKAVLRAKSFGHHKRSLMRCHRDVERGVGMVKLMHHCLHLVDHTKYRDLSINAAKKFFSEGDRCSVIARDVTKLREMGNVWSKTSEFLPFLYAADAIMVSKNITLLSYIQSGRRCKPKHVATFPLWLQKASYCLNHIMRPNIRDSLIHNSWHVLSPDNCFEIAVPHLPDVDVMNLERVLKRKRQAR